MKSQSTRQLEDTMKKLNDFKEEESTTDQGSMKYSNFTTEDKEMLLLIFLNNPKTLDVVRRSIFQHNDMQENYSKLKLTEQNVT